MGKENELEGKDGVFVTPKIIGKKNITAEEYMKDDVETYMKVGVVPKIDVFNNIYGNGIAFQKTTLTFGLENKQYLLEVHADDIAKGKNKMPEYQTFEFDRAFKLEDGIKQIFSGEMLADIMRDLEVMKQRVKEGESEYAQRIELPNGTKTYKEVYDHQIKMGLVKHDSFEVGKGLYEKIGERKCLDYSEGRINDKTTFQTFNYDNPKTASKTYVLQVMGITGSEGKTDCFQFSKPFTNYEARDFIHDWNRAQRTEKIVGKTYEDLLKEHLQQYKSYYGAESDGKQPTRKGGIKR